MMEATCFHTFHAVGNGKDRYHKRLRLLLDLLFPGLSLEEQLKKAWVTETYLCSAPVEGGSVPSRAESECASRYLQPQLMLLAGRPVIALGGKAQKRASRVMPDPQNLVSALHPSARESNEEFQRSYESAAREARAIGIPTSVPQTWDRK